MMTVRIETAPSFRAGTPELLFDAPYLSGSGVQYDVAADGERFLMIAMGTDDTTASPELVLVLNWTEELKQLVPTDN